MVIPVPITFYSKLTQLYNTAYYMLKAKADAEDAVQQRMMNAWAARERAKPDTFKAWLAHIVVNECHNIQRQRMRVAPSNAISLQQSDYIPFDPDLMDAVSQLPEMFRAPFVLKCLACLTEQEVAHAMHLPVSTIKTRLTKARK